MFSRKKCLHFIHLLSWKMYDIVFEASGNSSIASCRYENNLAVTSFIVRSLQTWPSIDEFNLNISRLIQSLTGEGKSVCMMIMLQYKG